MSVASVPFHVPSITDREISSVVEVLRSRWLTTGAQAARFEAEFAKAVGAKHAVAVNSCTAALHLALAALGLEPRQAVLVPTMTFAATAEVVRYMGAFPILVDCEPRTLNLDFDDAERKIAACANGTLPSIPPGTRAVGIMPVHVGGAMVDINAVRRLAARYDLWTVEDAAHAFPAAWRENASAPWQRCGEHTSDVTCFSFYANKTITTGEGGMAVTANQELANTMRRLSLHGLSRAAWSRYAVGGSWDYQILAPGYKYNLTDMAAAIGLCQLERADEMRRRREEIAEIYRTQLGSVDEIELPDTDPNRLHSWHLFPIRCRLDRLAVDRNVIFEALKDDGISCSVHWRPLHLHAYYRDTYGWQATDCPIASWVWETLISLPIYPDMTSADIERVVSAVKSACTVNRRELSVASGLYS
jgi:perosamine synthetase